MNSKGRLHDLLILAGVFVCISVCFPSLASSQTIVPVGGTLSIGGTILKQSDSSTSPLSGTITVTDVSESGFSVTDLVLTPSSTSISLDFASVLWTLGADFQSLDAQFAFPGVPFVIQTASGNFATNNFPIGLFGTLDWNGTGTICVTAVKCPDSESLSDLGVLFGDFFGTISQIGDRILVDCTLTISLDASSSKASGFISADFGFVIGNPGLVRPLDTSLKSNPSSGLATFGGTVWDPVDGRWEAKLNDTWTFDSGIGSHYVHSAPGVDPSKNLALHALMEGWIGVDLSPGGGGGEWSDIVSLADLPAPLTPCLCNVEDSVLVFKDATNGHNLQQDNVALSPWIDLDEHGLAGVPEKRVEFDTYLEFPLRNYISLKVVAESNDGFVEQGVYGAGPIPLCTTGSQVVSMEVGHLIPPGETDFRVGIGVVSFCRFFGDCTGVTNTTPWIDNVRVVVGGNPDAPLIAAAPEHHPQDSFPQNGTLRLDAPGRVDCNVVKGFPDPRPYSSLGDTLVVTGGLPGYGANTNCEVYMQFAVDWGPGVSPGAPFWLASHDSENTWKGQQWYSARIDTAEQGGQTIPGKWMSTYHEDDPNFSGDDGDLDANDIDVNGGFSHLANDIFPEGLGGIFTPGTRVSVFFKTRYVDAGGAPTTGVWATYPDTAGGNCLEMEVLPSSAQADSSWNCILYIDHEGRSAQEKIETALTATVVGSSENFEQTTWDRWDVNGPALHQGSFGRILNTVYGASVYQMFAYKTAIWNTGALFEHNLEEEDANILIPWLTLVDTGLGMNNLYITGDNIATSISSGAASEPGALLLLNQWFGVSLTCETVRDAGCPTGSVFDTTSCMEVDPVGGAHFVGNDGPNTVVLQGNGCPELHSFDLLSVQVGANGTPKGNENYDGAIKGTHSFESISNDAMGGPDYKTVFDGASIHHRRELDCTSETPITDRMGRVLNWFGYDTHQTCVDPLLALDHVPTPDDDRKIQVLGLRFSRNPMRTGIGGSALLTVPSLSQVRVQVVDLQGRIVSTVLDGFVEKGARKLQWKGTNDQGQSVASGVYFFVLSTPGETITQKVVLLSQ